MAIKGFESRGKQPSDFKVELMDTAAVIPYERNPRHNLSAIDKVAASIKEFGWRQPIVVGPDKVIVVGHTRHMAALRLGLKKIPVHVAHGLTPEQLKAYRIADNRTAEESDWDKELLSIELGDLREADFDLGLTGFSAAEIDELMVEAAGGVKHKDPDKVIALPTKAKTRPRDVWILGNHRVRCGDARRLEDVRAATDNRLVDVIWTEPPADESRLKVRDYPEFLLLVMRTLCKMARDGACVYVAHTEIDGASVRAAFADGGFKLGSCLIWRKDSFKGGRGDYQQQHEPILYGWKSGKPHRWYGGRKEVTLRQLEDEVPLAQLADGSWQLTLGNSILTLKGNITIEEFLPSLIDEARPMRSGLHPTMKPTALIERMLKNSAQSGDLVLDVFGGSGSTLIAAERLGMKAALVEIDAAYCDVIVDRWQEYTGDKAYREGEKKPTPKRAKSPKTRKTKAASRGTTAPAQEGKGVATPSSTDAELDQISEESLSV